MGWIGYYYVVGPQGDHLDAVAPWTNWIHVDIGNALQLPATEALAARCEAAGVQVCYSVIPILWIPQAAPLPYVLHPNWRERFAAQLRWYDAFQNRGILHSLYVMDEPTANGVPGADLRMVCDWIHANTPYRTMVVEEIGHEANPLPTVDYYGLTAYTPVQFATARAAVLGNQAVNVIVAQAFNERPYPIPDQWQWYALWREIRTRPRAGMALFTYPGYAQGARDYVGSAEDHGVRAVHALMAREIARP